MARSADLIFNLIGKDKTGPAFKAAAGNADKTRGSFDQVGVSMGKLAKLAGGLALGAGIVAGSKALAGFAMSATMAASDLGEVRTANEQIFGSEAAAELNAWSAKAATALGQTKTQALDAAKTFGVFGKAAGLSGTDLSGFSMELTTLATDMASFNNTSPEEAIEAIGAALRGEAEPMRRFGVLLDDATLRARAMEMGIYDGSGALTQQQKVLAAHQEILAQTSDQQGDFAKTSGGMANQLRATTAIWENIKIAAGEALVPVAEKFLPMVNAGLAGLLTSVEENMPQIQARVVGFADDVIAKWPEVKVKLEEAFAGIKSEWPEIKDTLNTFGDALERVAGFGQLMWDAFKSLPPEAQKIIALLAVAKTSGVLSVAFKATDLVKSLFAANVTVVASNVVTPGAGGAAGTAGKAGAVGALTLGGAVTIAVGTAAIAWSAIEILKGYDSNERTESDSRPGSTMGDRAAVAAGTSAGGSPGTAGLGAMIAGWLEADQAVQKYNYSLSRANEHMSRAQPSAQRLAQSVAAAGTAAGASQLQISAVSAAVQKLPAGANIEQLRAAIAEAGRQAGLTEDQIAGMTSGVLNVPAAGNLPALQMQLAFAGSAAGLTSDQVTAMSAAVNMIPPGATAVQVGEAIRIAGQKAGMSDSQIRSMTAAVTGIPGAAQLPNLQTAIANAGRAAGLTDGQVRTMSASVFAIPRGATAEQAGEAIRVAGQKAGLTKTQVDTLIAAINGIPPNKTSTITTNADAERTKIGALQLAINSLAGKELKVGVKLEGSYGGGPTGGSGGTSTYTGSAGGVSSWLTGEVDGLANALAPKLAATGDIGSGPWVRPTSNYSVSSEWMRGGTAIHYGIDLAAPMGTPVHSVAAGRVTRAFWNNGYGNFVEVDHGGVYTSYSHLSAILASAGQTVGPGSVIGAIGSTGDSTGPHLHFETRPGGQAVEPRGFMRSRGVELRAGGMVPVNVSNGEWFVPETKAKDHMPLLHAINAGQINGPGTGTSDSIPGAARPGAFVVNAAQTRRNRSLLRSITHGSGPSQYLAGGGVVGSGGAVFAGGAQTVELHISGRVLYGALSDYRRDSGRAVLEFA